MRPTYEECRVQDENFRRDLYAPQPRETQQPYQEERQPQYVQRVQTPRQAVTPRPVGTPRRPEMVSNQSFASSNDEELVLVCADCGDEIIEGTTREVCPVSGKLHF